MSYKLLTQILMCGNQGNDYTFQEKQQIEMSLRNETKMAFKELGNRIIVDGLDCLNNY